MVFYALAIPVITLEYYSTVIELYGKYEGSKKGYKPKRQRRNVKRSLPAERVLE